MPFALLGGTAIGSGRGEVVTPLMTRGEYWWVVLESPHGLATPEVYREFDALHHGSAANVPEVPDDLMQALRRHDVAKLGAALCNDLQPAAFRLRPELAGALGQGQARLGSRRVLSGPVPPACSCARTGRMPHGWPAGSETTGSGRCRSPRAPCTVPASSPRTSEGR